VSTTLSPLDVAALTENSSRLGSCLCGAREERETMRAALKVAESFIAEELEVRRNSFLPEGSEYIAEATAALEMVRNAMALPVGAPHA